MAHTEDCVPGKGYWTSKAESKAFRRFTKSVFMHGGTKHRYWDAAKNRIVEVKLPIRMVVHDWIYRNLYCKPRNVIYRMTGH